MAGGLHSSLRPTSTSTSPSSSSSSSSASSQIFTSRILLLLTLLPLTLAVFAFLLQWRGGGLINDPTTRWSTDPSQQFPGMSTFTTLTRPSSIRSSDCADLLGQSRTPSFPYYRDWKFAYNSDLKPKADFWSRSEN